MSVIQDALQRKLEEQRAAKESRASVGRPEPQPPQAPPVAQQVFENETALNPPPAISQQVSVTRRPVRSDPQRTIRLLLVTIIVILTVGLVGAVIYFVDARKNEFVQSAFPAHDSGNRSSETPQGESNSPDGAVNSTPQGVNSGAGGSGKASTESARTVAEATGKWPLVNVGGVIAGGSAGKNSAILNGDMIRVNRKIDGVLLVDVKDEGVTLEYGGDQRFVEIGSTTLD